MLQKIDEYNLDNFNIDTEHVAFNTETKKICDVWVSDKSYFCGCMMGRIRVVIDGNSQPITYAMPLLNFSDKTYELLTKNMIERYKEISESYKNYES